MRPGFPSPICAASTGVLVLEAVQALRLADIHSAIPGLPLVNGRIADHVLAAQTLHLFLPAAEAAKTLDAAPRATHASRPPFAAC